MATREITVVPPSLGAHCSKLQPFAGLASSSWDDLCLPSPSNTREGPFNAITWTVKHSENPTNMFGANTHKKWMVDS